MLGQWLGMTMTDWTPEELYLIAQRAYEFAAQGRFDVAATLFEGLLEVSPTHGYARRSLAAIQIQMGRAGAALETLKSLPAGDAAARRLRIEAHLALGARAEAAAEFSAGRAALEPRAARRFALLLESARPKQLSGRPSDK
jgi:thioredoxin-like negative regulator of GroEL